MIHKIPFASPSKVSKTASILKKISFSSNYYKASLIQNSQNSRRKAGFTLKTQPD
jgi:hypothetical protein